MTSNIVEKPIESSIRACADGRRCKQTEELLKKPYDEKDFQNAVMFALSFPSCQECFYNLVESGSSLDFLSTGLCAGWTPLMKAAVYEDRLGHLSAMVFAGVDLNATDEQGVTALMVACMHGNPTCAAALILHGADVDKRDKEGMTAFAHAAVPDSARDSGNNAGKVECMHLLMAARANINLHARDRTTILERVYAWIDDASMRLLRDYAERGDES